MIGGGSLLGHNEMLSAQALILQKNKQKQRDKDLKNERLSKKNGGVKKESDYMRKKALAAAAASATAAAAAAAAASAAASTANTNGAGTGLGSGMGSGPGAGTGVGNAFTGGDTTQTAANYGQFANGGELSHVVCLNSEWVIEIAVN